MNAYEIEIDEDDYERELSELYGTVNICGMEYDAGRALRELDPTAFRVGIADKPTEYACGECDENHGEDSDAAEECCQPEPPDRDYTDEDPEDDEADKPTTGPDGTQ